MELRERIVEEASRLFFQNGIRSMTMSDIAANIGISKRTLYEVFQDKEELLSECLDKSIKEADQKTKELLLGSDNVIDTMMRIYARHLDEAHKMNKSVVHDLRKYHPQLYKKMECRQEDGLDKFRPLFQKAIEQGLVRDDINIEVLTWLLKVQFKALVEDELIPTDKYPASEFVRAIILNFTRGIATTEGNRKIDEMISKLDNKRNSEK